MARLYKEDPETGERRRLWSIGLCEEAVHDFARALRWVAKRKHGVDVKITEADIIVEDYLQDGMELDRAVVNGITYPGDSWSFAIDVLAPNGSDNGEEQK
jgi:hypothetical protein